MQPPTTDTNHERLPYKLNVFLFGNDVNETKHVKQYHKYTHETMENSFSIDDDSDDDEHLILSGKNSVLCVC
jgi:hypothetical protein